MTAKPFRWSPPPVPVRLVRLGGGAARPDGGPDPRHGQPQGAREHGDGPGMCSATDALAQPQEGVRADLRLGGDAVQTALGDGVGEQVV